MIKLTQKYLKIASYGAFIILGACASSGPATTYYALATEKKFTSEDSSSSIDSIGVGPIKLAAYLDNTSIVSKTESHVLNVSGYHAWAEPLDSAIARVLAQGLSAELAHDDVWTFPWDSRNRPQKQINIVIDQLDGVRGESISLNAKWFVLESEKNKLVSKGSFSSKVDLNSSSYQEYVSAIQKVLDEFSGRLANELGK